MINIIITSDPRYSINRTVIYTAIVNVLRREHVLGNVELEVSIAGNRKMHELNKKYCGLDYPADILTFALEDPHPQNLQLLPRMGFIAAPDKILRLGSICISYSQAVEDASLEGISVEDEIIFLVEYGTNHLLGIHHG
ncbi:MAG: putative rRNA maturation factor [Candidatus Daviesbacteria bacterium GW2011_GWA1_41_61]|uniref:Putative rRNA maturation factor n=1 Tax=Candidatus Daviesbacteria bacterium GW2011_GWA2_40_9 TaxID=1618424 RepID=A0A0G0U7Q4_9BACT|nr:MAG: hypothetical protein UU26_C0003G0166 [Candidatus Daviesbacteria bacterium GW2011_GWC1_40_9]KKR83241.1 MAG: putative rRNA maturation factor [Candidatus Daviesbacteria bacterium GW2011_GWA2_40_9]KKR93586.1 MAG: putative rRNA maturation factor [Candidatus Daviesbacteria bacterium GW2011_GWB1_41_15]KKS14863.1 MAG: putative rRNA maturation factor [Candidatus Daviesbacteria bacterium GW2011_GWA1_41_61]